MRIPLPSSYLRLLPSRSPRAAELVRLLADAARRTDGLDGWRAAIGDLYGDLSGQRALDRDREMQRFTAGRPGIALPDLIVALQTYYALICDGLALGRYGVGAVPPLREWSAYPAARLRRSLAELASGGLFHKLGVEPSRNPLPLDWYADRLSSKALALLGETLADVADLCDALDVLPPFIDLPQRIYAALMPKNLLHILGEFYTPSWMAQLLLDDARWEPSQSLMDPFAGSGAFLLAAIEKAASLGCACRELLPRLCAVDRSPAAYVALRANLLLALARDPGGVRLPIHCADSLLDPLPPPADVLVTNPPWVGWEYIPRTYRRRLSAAWNRYSLYTAKGREASFLKEDLSTLALVVAWDRCLRNGGVSSVVVRPAAMHGRLAGRGLRRLSLFPDATPLGLRRIRLFTDLRPFRGTDAQAAAWLLEKGAATVFPIPVLEWKPKERCRRSDAVLSVAEVRRTIVETERVAERTDPSDSGAAWIIGDRTCCRITHAFAGSHSYQVRTGVFTGGANAVYYLRPMDGLSATGASRYRNGTNGAKRDAEAGEWEIEDELVYEVVRGRDLGWWSAPAGARLLCPHTAQTRMRPLAPSILATRYPKASAYLGSMRPVLEARRGFAGWERRIRDQTYYAIQRIGEYTFAPFKTAWRYVASDFIVAVVGPGRDGRPRLCNDKVMYAACASEDEAHYLCGLLSSDPVRWRVVSAMTGTQISTSAIKYLHLPSFRGDDPLHAEIAQWCKSGHEAVAAGELQAADAALAAVNRVVGRLYSLSTADLRCIREELARRYPVSQFHKQC
ncbi:MAG TPA: N-6 DNA methylase [Gemmataceae bacterium]|nr:N-6 DNA methylase [Gemmataceae bacterium]